jgi:integrase
MRMTDAADILAFQVSGFVLPHGEIRHVLTHRETDWPTRAGSLYEVHLEQRSDSPNTRREELRHLAYLYSWAEEGAVDLDGLLLRGDGLAIAQIRAFSASLKARWMLPSGTLPPSAREAHNKILYGCSTACVWFIEQFARPSGGDARRAIDVQIAVDAQKRAWSSNKQNVRKRKMAPDLADEQIAIIEAFLKPQSRTKLTGPSIATRDYLMWRMAIECGMRMGEILAMRTVDCPTRGSPYFRIVRIEERETDSLDPRAPYAPRPKTLSRDLGFLLADTVFPRLVSDYVSIHRHAMVERSGKKVKQFLLPHKFLVISRRGEPLSTSAMQGVAEEIGRATGIRFHWHLARHAFFNRAYATVAAIENRSEREVRLQDLVYWGGWRDAESLHLYTQRARRDRARNALSIWQMGGNAWPALK